MKLLSSLTNRIFLATTLLAVLAIGFTVVFVSTRVTASAEVELERGLVEAGALVENHGRDIFDTFSLLAKLIADIPILKAAIGTGDPPTVHSLVEDYRRLLTKADVVAVTDRSGRVLAVSGGTQLTSEEVGGLASVRGALDGMASTAYWTQPSGVLQLVTVPVTAGQNPPEIIGTLSVGFLLDRRLAAQFKQLTGSEIAFAFDGRVRASTLAAGSDTALEALLGSSGISHVMMGGEEFVGVLQRLPPVSPLGSQAAANAPAPASGSRAQVPVAIVLRSSTERLRFLQTVNKVTVLTLVVTVLLATVLAYAIARTVTRPLGAITAVMREIAVTGDLARKITPPSHWDDEDARLLAATFNTLTESIARFQEEVAQRERLSSLGRLSAIVAHEIRNPLMIIKASLRALTRVDASSSSVAEAASDIDGEVTRLNRVVNEVLDYAKPLRFDLAPADLNAVCADAVAAAQAGETEPGIDLHLDSNLPQVTTDAERIRTVLINVITNARLAVRARASAPGTRPDGASGAAPIQVRTSCLDPGHVVAVVADAGAGIDPAVLPRVFDPFFTTRRSGTGLGLAIAKNVINGLGGGITVRSELNVGTEVRIELPLSAPGPAMSPAPRANT